MYLMAIPGPVFPVINTEAVLLLRVAQDTLDPLGLVLAAAAGHMTLYLILHELGEKTLHKWAYVKRKLEKLTPEQRERFKNSTTAGFVMGSLLGVPPVFLLAPLSSSLGYPRLAVAFITFTGRVARFSVLVFAGKEVRAWFGR